jgi:hypothetical protein
MSDDKWHFTDKTHHDDQLGNLEWDAVWHMYFVLIDMLPYQRVRLILPKAYVESNTIRSHIREILPTIDANKAAYLARAAKELLNNDNYRRNVHLASIYFDMEFIENYTIDLWYRYDDDLNKGITVILDWNAQYSSAMVR